MKFTEEEVRFIREFGKTLVDANKIKAVVPCKMPVNGDLVRINVECSEYIAVCCHYPLNPVMYYVTQDGRMIANTDGVQVLEIIGRCVFSVYV